MARKTCATSNIHLLSPAISAGAVEIDQDVARFGAFARADDAAVFQFVHDTRGTRVTEAQTALEQGDARLLLAADNFDALLNQALVLIGWPFFHTETARGFL